jgi:hypothetical protein
MHRCLRTWKDLSSGYSAAFPWRDLRKYEKRSDIIAGQKERFKSVTSQIKSVSANYSNTVFGLS